MTTTHNRVLTWLSATGMMMLVGLAACEKKPTQAAAPTPTPAPSSPNTPNTPNSSNSPTGRVAPQEPEAAKQPTKEAVKEPVSKIATPSAPAATGASGEMVGPFKVPAGWAVDATPKPMRVATYMAPAGSGKVEVAVTKFPGRVGGELANINRWRGQMGVAAVDAAGLEATLTRFAAAGFEGYETRIESAKGVMLAAGVYEAASDQTWFVRATAKDAAEADGLQSALFGMGRSVMEGKK